MIVGRQFTDLYHGTNVEGLKEIEPRQAMSYGAFSTNNPREAAQYARDKARERGGKPVVYEVEHDPGDIEVDPYANPMTWGPDYESLDEAREAVQDGGWTSFVHSRLKTKRAMPVEDAERIADERGWGSSWNA